MVDDYSDGRLCGYCGSIFDRLYVVGFYYRFPILYCESCKGRLEAEPERMKLQPNVMVVNDGTHSVPVLIGVENLESPKGVDVDMEEWLRKEKERMDKEREDILKSKGFESLYRFEEGETRVKLETKMPELRDGQQGRKFAVFNIEVNGKKERTGTNMTSPLYREFINRMATGKTEFMVIRTGSGMKTRYAFKD